MIISNKKLLLVSILSLTINSVVVWAESEFPMCEPACVDSQYCVRVDKNKKPVCKPIPTLAPLKNLILPFKTGENVYCTHSSGSGSHSWANSFFALDLASSYEQAASTILASEDGKAFVFVGEDGRICPQPEGTPSNAVSSSCGKSWGNHIKILHKDGYYSFYVHLERPLIANGTRVKKGQPIGIEGWTGAAGHRHLHWGVQKLPCANDLECEKRIDWDGESVPFEFRANVNGKLTTVDTNNFKCPHANIGDVPKDQQPLLRAVK